MKLMVSRKHRRMTAMFLAALILLSLTVAVACLVCHSHHVCTGVDCRICDCVRRCGELLRGLARVLAAAVILAALLAGMLFSRVLCTGLLTPTAQRVRMND